MFLPFLFQQRLQWLWWLLLLLFLKLWQWWRQHQLLLFVNTVARMHLRYDRRHSHCW